MLSSRQARRLSQRFAGVGVKIPATRLQQIAAGAPAGSDELLSVDFALAAIEIRRAERLARLKRRRRCWIRWLVVGALVLVALNLLLCIVCLFVGLTLHEWPL